MSLASSPPVWGKLVGVSGLGVANTEDAVHLGVGEGSTGVASGVSGIGVALTEDAVHLGVGEGSGVAVGSIC